MGFKRVGYDVCTPIGPLAEAYPQPLCSSDRVETPSRLLQDDLGLCGFQQLLDMPLARQALLFVHHSCNAHRVGTHGEVPARHARQSWFCIPAEGALWRPFSGCFAVRYRCCSRTRRVNLEVLLKYDLPRCFKGAVWTLEMFQTGMRSDVPVEL